jgi:hypothetical protein
MLPFWISCVAVIVVIVPMAVVGLTAAKAQWLRIERIVTLLFFVFAEVGIVVNLASLIREMVHRSAGIDGLQLLSSSVAVWVANVLVFSILYWQMDRGGLEARANKAEKKLTGSFLKRGLSRPCRLVGGRRSSTIYS